MPGAPRGRSHSLATRLALWYAASAFGLVLIVTAFLHWSMVRSIEQAEALIHPLESEIRRRLGRFIYGIDAVTLEQAVVRQLIEGGKTVACAESCTGGLLGARLTSVPGSSAAGSW